TRAGAIGEQPGAMFLKDQCRADRLTAVGDNRLADIAIGRWCLEAENVLKPIGLGRRAGNHIARLATGGIGANLPLRRVEPDQFADLAVHAIEAGIAIAMEQAIALELFAEVAGAGPFVRVDQDSGDGMVTITGAAVTIAAIDMQGKLADRLGNGLH